MEYWEKPGRRIEETDGFLGWIFFTHYSSIPFFQHSGFDYSNANLS